MTVAAGYIEYMSNDFVSRAVQPVLYKSVFHGGLKSMWSSVMEVGKSL